MFTIFCFGSSNVGGKNFRLPRAFFKSREAAEAALHRWEERVSRSSVADLLATRMAASSIRVVEE